jgi:protein O-GlcNAc transferase
MAEQLTKEYCSLETLHRIGILLQRACEPCLQGDIEGACIYIEQAADCLRSEAQLDDDDVLLWAAFARHLVHMWMLITNWELLCKLLRIYPWDAPTHSDLLLCQHYLPNLDPETVAHQHRRWARIHTADIPETSDHPNDLDPDRPLRIAYVSPDLYTHCVANFFESLLDSHDREGFELYGYGNVPSECRDGTTERLVSKFDQYRDIWELDDQAAIELIQTDGIDILVDLSGHTRLNRLTVFAHRPAPVQVSYLGYPHTTGMRQIDYRLTDSVADHAEQQQFYTEKLIRLDTCFACYRPPETSIELSQPPVLKQGYITFGAFIGSEKHNPVTVSMWADLLEKNPEAKLLLRFCVAQEGLVQQQCREAFVRRGISPERVVFDGMRGPADHLLVYNQIDIALDTYPWNSHTSMCEALWMGVPVVTLTGKAFVSRMGRSVLERLELGFFATASPDEYAKKATALACDTDALAKLRAMLRERMLNSVICNAPAQARAIENAYRDMWRRWCK